MLPDRVSNPGPLTYESGALPIALRGPRCRGEKGVGCVCVCVWGVINTRNSTSYEIRLSIYNDGVRPVEMK